MKLRRSIGHFIARFRRAEDGLSAVEFALLLPVMAMFYLGGVQISMAVSTYRLVDLTANTVTNLIAQYTTISKAHRCPISCRRDSSHVSGHVNDPAYRRTSKWSCRSSRSTKTAMPPRLESDAQRHRPHVGSKVTVPPSMITAGTATNILLGETNYDFNAPIDFLKLGTITCRQSLFMVPRASTTINLTS